MADTHSRELDRDAKTGDVVAAKRVAYDQCRQGNHYWSDWVSRGIPRKGMDRDVHVWSPYKLAAKLGFTDVRHAYLGSRRCFFCGHEQRRLSVEHHYTGWDALLRKHVMTEDEIYFD